MVAFQALMTVIRAGVGQPQDAGQASNSQHRRTAAAAGGGFD
jgi:hypothetical protein